MSEQQQSATGRVVREELRTSAPSHDVYAAFADPARLAQWFVDRASGEARAGETMVWEWDAFAMAAPYEVVEADPGRRLVLRAPPGVAPPGVIDITIRSERGQTVLTLVNSGFLDGADWDELFEGVRSGWTMALALLREYLENYHGRPKRSFVHMRPSPFGFAALWGWFTEDRQLRRWLTTSGAPALDARPFSLVLHDGTRVDARVVARTERELMLSLPGEEAVLELKAFGVPREPSRDTPAVLQPALEVERIVCLRGTVWSPDDARFTWLRDLCGGAIDRLVRAEGAE